MIPAMTPVYRHGVTIHESGTVTILSYQQEVMTPEDQSGTPTTPVWVIATIAVLRTVTILVFMLGGLTFTTPAIHVWEIVLILRIQGAATTQGGATCSNNP